MDEQVTAWNRAVCMIDKIHNLSLRVLTLCGFGALICLSVNIITALVMFGVERKQKQTKNERKENGTWTNS